MMKIVHFVLLICLVSAQWEFLDEDLIDFTVSASNWKFGNSCDWNTGSAGGGGSAGKCSDNDIGYIYVGTSKTKGYYEITNLSPHYQVKILVDGYFLDSSTSNTYYITYDVQGSTTTTYSLNYKDSSLGTLMVVCNPSWQNFEIQTYIMPFQHNDNSNLKFRICGTNFSSSRNYGSRAFQIYINRCHWSCLKCQSSNAINNCLACFTNPNAANFGSPTTCGTCPTNTVYIEYLDSYKSCVTDCHYYRTPDTNKVCQFNQYMLPFMSQFDGNTFSSTTPWLFEPDPINFNLLSDQKIGTIPCQTTKNYVGPFYFNEAFTLALTLPYNITYIRFRTTIFKFGSWNDYSAVHVLLDSIEQASVYSLGQTLTARNADTTYSDSNCTTPVVSYLRIEAKLKSNFTNVVLRLKGSMDTQGVQYWGFRDLVLDILKCQSSCSWCDYDQQCYACSTGFLYKNRCVPSCPSFTVQSTGKCTDYDEAVDNSNYVIKAFYDSTNTTDTDVATIVGTMSGGSSDFKTTDHFTGSGTAVWFSYYKSRRVLGGPLVWNSAAFSKTISSLNYHYKFRIMFTVVFGDNFSGDFRYTVANYTQTIVTTAGATTASDNVGKTNPDKYVVIDRTEYHSTNSITIALECNSSANIKDNFCIVYDYFLIMLECTQYCTACTGPTWALCTTKLALPVGMTSPTTCVSASYYLDTTVNPAVCVQCSPVYCLECQNSQICTKCDTNFYLINGQCQCYPWTYLTASNTCSSCNSLCDACYGYNSNQCLSCKYSQHRYLNNNSCVCMNNYYDDGVNLICQSVCGDMVVTAGEDCDDGNTIRFDGCNNCKFECQKECSVCVSGKCQQCITGYTLNKTMKRCFSTCGDNKIVPGEYCEDSNSTPYDGCYNCQYQCQSSCTNCVYGICQACDNINGYYLNLATNKCQTLCGDMIVAGGEMCDDGNSNPFDSCHNCAFSCDSFCDLCNMGVCVKCKSGFQLLFKSGQCSPICGDKIVTYYESCDDGNLINYDGCDQCQLACQEQCTKCLFGQCQECNAVGYILNKKQSKCYSSCGDGVKILQFEQCDDANFPNEDGCYQCKYECQQECLTCAAGICYQCKSNYYLDSNNLCSAICGDGVQVKPEACDDKNYIIEDGCQDCAFKCEKACSTCSFGVCTACKTGYYLNQSKKKCLPICGDSLIVSDEQCDLGIVAFDLTIKNNTSCFNCQLSCSPQCDVCAQGQCVKCKESKGWYLDNETLGCFSYCGDSIISDYEECEDSNSQLNDGCTKCLFKCQEECLLCKFGICQSCKTGYNLINGKCYSVCGDGILAGNEECDYGILQLDGYGCVNCKYKCQDGCSNCYKGQCIICDNNSGFYENTFTVNQCNSTCGDYKVTVAEQCDSKLSTCQSCKIQCNDNCKSCFLGVCIACNSGFKLQNNQCLSICGDNIIIQNEQCESSDIIPFDGCFNCNYQCQSQCIQCVNGECVQCNTDQGWYLEKTKCITLCGDGIIAGDEECDILLKQDNGIISLNKCFNCKYQCVDNCQTCNNGQCVQCKQGFKLNDLNNCETICGDLKLQLPFEQCDDQNIQAFDGCFQCEYDCQPECSVCVKGQCLFCSIGFRLNNGNQQCESVCGDKIISYIEDCDDGNNIPYDGCHLCKFSCTQNCLNCQKGICYQCQAGYELKPPYCLSECQDIIQYTNTNTCLYNSCQDECLECLKGQCYSCKQGWYWNKVEYICESKCGDNIIVNNEQCEGNSLQRSKNLFCNTSCEYDCPNYCVDCQFGECYNCESGYYLSQNQCLTICGDMSQTKTEECEDNNLIAFDGCFLCKRDCDEKCLICINGSCAKCFDGYYLKENDSCVAICGDGIVSKEEDCDDQNTIEYDGCYKCKFQCDPFCKYCKFGICQFCQSGFELKGQKCIPLCGDGLIVGNEQCDDQNLEAYDGCFECKYSCQQECLNCQYGYCIQCEDNGWHLSPLRFCETQCGDMVVAGNEQCDDGNDINFDGCYECEYICQEACTKCLTGACFECNTPGWRLDNFFCWEICGDGLRVGIEECDDGNDTPYDGCFDCKTQCEEACTSCFAGKCSECKVGWLLNSNSRCETICGDSLVIPLYEDCDDGNLLPYDGCYECNFQCVQFCTICEQGICQECNTPGWTYELEQKICIPICGDAVVNGYEQCDDGNLIKYDGCSNQCEFQCHQACLNCENGICLECDPYQGFFQSGKQCSSKCGDGLWEPTSEQCDDGNLIRQDGCNEFCQIEVDWYCENYPLQISFCIFRHQPFIKLKLLNQDNEKSLLKVTFSRKMMFSPEFTNNQQQNITLDDKMLNKLFVLQIDEILHTDYSYKSVPIEPLDIFPKDIIYHIELSLAQNIKIDKIQVYVVADNQILVSENEIELRENVAKIDVPIIYTPSSLERKVIAQVDQINQISYIALYGVSFLSIFTSGYHNFFITCDTLQYLYYARYINLAYPQNLDTVMKSFKKTSLFNQVQDQLNLTFINDLSIKNKSTKKLRQNEGKIPEKFYQNNIDYTFSTNITASLTAIAGGLAVFCLTLMVSRTLHLISPSKLSKLGFLGNVILKIRSKCSHIQKQFLYSGFIRITTINFFELQFASLLQLSNIELNSIENIMNNISAISTLSFTLIFTGVIFEKVRRIQSKQSLEIKYYFKTLFTQEETENHQSTWQFQYNTLLLVKKSVYMFIIVGLQPQSFYQTTLVAIQALSFAVYLIVAHPFSNNDDHRKVIITELGMFVNTLSFTAYYSKDYFQIQKETLNYIGWFNVGIFSTILLSNLIIDVIRQLKLIYKKAKNFIHSYLDEKRPSQSRVKPIFI